MKARKSKPARVASLRKVLAILRDHRSEIEQNYKVREILVFGSFVRGEQKQRSDVDVLVEFQPGHLNFNNYMDLKFFLEKILSAKVDLITKTGLKPRIKDQVLAEAVNV